MGIAAALVVLTAGCGGDGDSGSDDGGADFTKQSADEISDAAKAAMGDLTAVTIDGTLSSEGNDIEITMSIGEGGNCTGSFGTQGATAEILGVEGTTWFRPDAAFWELFAGPEVAPQIIAAAGDKWVTLPDDDTSFKPFCDIEQFLGELVEGDGGEEAEYSKGETKEIDGEQTIEVISDRPDKGVVERLRPHRGRPLPGQHRQGRGRGSGRGHVLRLRRAAGRGGARGGRADRARRAGVRRLVRPSPSSPVS